VLVEVLEPLCRSCTKLLKKDCSAAVPAWAEALVGLLESGVAEAPVVLVEVPAVVPPKSVISLENAAFNALSVLADTLEDEPEAADVALTSWLLLKSLISEVSAAMRPCCPYCAMAPRLLEVVDAADAVTGVVVAGDRAAEVGAVVAGVVAAGVDTDVVVMPEVVVPLADAAVDVGVLFVVTGAGATTGV
jgi:hypothetical protein